MGFVLLFVCLSLCGQKDKKSTQSLKRTLWRFDLQMNVTFNSAGGPDLTTYSGRSMEKCIRHLKKKKQMNICKPIFKVTLAFINTPFFKAFLFLRSAVLGLFSHPLAKRDWVRKRELARVFYVICALVSLLPADRLANHAESRWLLALTSEDHFQVWNTMEFLSLYLDFLKL